MKKLSRWAYYHPALTRRIMVVIKIVMLILTWRIAMLLQQLHIQLPTDSAYFLGALVLLGIFLYPDKKKKKIYFEKSYYYRQKFYYGLITFSSFAIFIVAFNNNLMVQGVYGVKPIYTATTENIDAKPGAPEKMTAKQKRMAKKAFWKQLKEIAVKVKQGEKGTTGLVLELILAITLASTLGVILLWVACSVSCTTSELLGILILILGAGAIAMGLVVWIKSIRRRKRERRGLAAR